MKFSQLLLGVLLLASCNVNKSFNKDLISGLETHGNGLSCDDVEVKHSDQLSDGNTYIFGDVLHFTFQNVEGFTNSKGKVFPGMSFELINSAGETVMSEEDLYAEKTAGIALSVPNLTSQITLGKPIVSGDKYKVKIHIWDKKGKGTFDLSYPITVERDPSIKVTSSSISFHEIYLWSEEKVVSEGKIHSDEQVYLLLEGLNGFADENGMVFPGAMARITDQSGKVIVQDDDIFASLDETGASIADLEEQLQVSFSLKNAASGSKFNLSVKIWDKISGEELNVKSVCEIK